MFMMLQVAVIRVMLQYLSDRMYDEVRGQGLTYGVSMAASVTEGRMTLSLTRLAEAFKAVQEILARYSDAEYDWDETLLESAVGSIVYSWTEKEETVEDLVGQAVKAYIRGTDSKYNRDFVRALGRVELADIVRTAQRILPAFLSAHTTMTAIVCNPASVAKIIQDFKELGIELKTYEALEDTFQADALLCINNLYFIFCLHTKRTNKYTKL